MDSRRSHWAGTTTHKIKSKPPGSYLPRSCTSRLDTSSAIAADSSTDLYDDEPLTTYAPLTGLTAHVNAPPNSDPHHFGQALSKHVELAPVRSAWTGANCDRRSEDRVSLAQAD